MFNVERIVSEEKNVEVLVKNLKSDVIKMEFLKQLDSVKANARDINISEETRSDSVLYDEDGKDKYGEFSGDELDSKSILLTQYGENLSNFESFWWETNWDDFKYLGKFSDINWVIKMFTIVLGADSSIDQKLLYDLFTSVTFEEVFDGLDN